MDAARKKINVMCNCIGRLQWHVDELARLVTDDAIGMDEEIWQVKVAYIEAVLMQLANAVQTTQTAMRVSEGV